jgi:hypothetical protein
MYDRKVLEPRMVAGWPPAALGALPPSLEAMRRAVSDHYRVEFDSVHVNLYRDGPGRGRLARRHQPQDPHQPAGGHRVTG